MTKKPQQESFYELHLNKNDEVMISIRAKDGNPKSPVLLYDGGAHALLYRTPEQSILLDFIHPDARPCLAQAESVLIAEAADYKVVREYSAKCRHVKNLPLDEASVKPLLDREQAKQTDERNLYK